MTSFLSFGLYSQRFGFKPELQRCMHYVLLYSFSVSLQLFSWWPSQVGLLKMHLKGVLGRSVSRAYQVDIILTWCNWLYAIGGRMITVNVQIIMSHSENCYVQSLYSRYYETRQTRQLAIVSVCGHTCCKRSVKLV